MYLCIFLNEKDFYFWFDMKRQLKDMYKCIVYWVFEFIFEKNVILVNFKIIEMV